MAFVFRAGSDQPSLTDLGPAKEIEGLVAAARSRVSQAAVSPLGATRQAEAAYRRAGDALRRRVWDPIAPLLRSVDSIFIVPDGILNVVTFAALPVGESGYLIDRSPRMHYLSAERDLLAADDVVGTGVLAVGDPAFDDGMLFAALRGPDIAPPSAPIKVASAAVFRGHPPSCGDFRSLQFAPLPSSGLEVSEVVAAWGEARAEEPPRLRGAHLSVDAEVLAGPAANELAVKLSAPGRDILHLATHGFFLGEGCPSAIDLGGDPATHGPNAIVGENPLLLSGLALAGANHRDAAGPDEDDGILTAEEISAMNLSGVRWAVLSACDTGLGEIRAGEGVLGLRRAFQVAGARTVIMSLWPVEDEASRQWMRALYSNRLVNGMSTIEAVHAASGDLLRQRRAVGASTPPSYWAAFVASGDWR